MHRSALRGAPEWEEKTWLDKLTEVDRKRARYQEMAAEELITFDELREKLASLEEFRTAAERALEEVRGRVSRIIELERDRDALLASYEALALEELDDLSPEEHHDFYRWLRMIVHAHPEGGIEIAGEFMLFDTFGPDESPDGPGVPPGTNDTGPGGKGADPTTRGFSTNKDTRACATAARARRVPAGRPRPGSLAARTPSRPPA